MVLTELLTSIADAIRDKTGKADKLKIADMADAIKGIGEGSISQEDFAMFMNGMGTLGYTPDGNKAMACYRVLKDWALTVETLDDNALNNKCLDYNAALPQYQSFIIEFPNLKTIGSKGIMYCYGKNTLSDVSFPSLTKIDDYGLSSNKFGSLKLPIVEELGRSALSHTSGFTSLSLAMVKELNNSELEDCLNLASVEFKSLQSIKASSPYSASFASCKNLETLILRSDSIVTLANKDGLVGEVTNPKKQEGDYYYQPIKDGTDKGYIYVPKALLEDYKVATNWSVFADKFRAIEDYPEICGDANDS